jgi:beta-galactosidase
MISVVSSLALLTVAAAAGGESLSLQGDWAFRLDPNGVGERESWQQQALPDRIRLPGTTDQAGYGTRTKGIEGGYLSRVHKHVGPAWYQREIEIPPSWAGRQIDLLLERVLWESRVWVDNKPCGSQDSLGTPHWHQLGNLAPGKHRLTIRVNNAMIHPIGDKGHCYTEETQTIWNGLVGRIELRPHDRVWIKQMRVFTDNNGFVRVEATLGNESFDPVAGALSLQILEQAAGRVVGAGKMEFSTARGLRPDHSHILYTEYPVEIAAQLSESPKLWDEFSPALYRAEVELRTGGKPPCADRQAATFGFRQIAKDGRRLLVNGRPTFIRGNLDCVHFPLTGYPACDVESWRRIFQIYKDYGLNQVRFHSWCPPEAAFQAADELGLYIQAEVLWIDAYMSAPNPRFGMNTPGYPQGVGKNDRTIDQYVRAEMRRMFDVYGNHPSFAMFVIGNEMGSSNFEVMSQWIKEEKARDPRRLYSASTARKITPTDDFSDTHNIPEVGTVVNQFGIPHTDWDYENSYRRAPVPIVAHEMGQMAVYPCWDEIGKYTGVLRARNLEGFRQQARRNGIESQSRELQLASGASNRIVYKNEIEAQLRSPSCSGVSWLSMQDYSGQGEALVGWLDSFYDSKGLVTPAEFRRYCNATVPLARFNKYVWVGGEKFRAVAQVAHWGPRPLLKAVGVWRLRDSQGSVIVKGQSPAVDLPVGAVTTLGPIEVDLPPAVKAARLVLDIALENTQFANQWNLWSFPKDMGPSDHANVVVTDSLDTALGELSQGKRVLLLAHRLGPGNGARYAAWMPVFWSATYCPGQDRETLGALVQDRHPALAKFPTESHLDWQWHEICAGGRGFVLDDLPADYRPIVQPVDDFHSNHKLGSVFEFRTKQGGKLLVCGYNLADNLAGRPAARQLRRSLLDYAGGPAFDPKQEVAPQYLTKLFSP